MKCSRRRGVGGRGVAAIQAEHSSEVAQVAKPHLAVAVEVTCVDIVHARLADGASVRGREVGEIAEPHLAVAVQVEGAPESVAVLTSGNGPTDRGSSEMDGSVGTEGSAGSSSVAVVPQLAARIEASLSFTLPSPLKSPSPQTVPDNCCQLLARIEASASSTSPSLLASPGIAPIVRAVENFVARIVGHQVGVAVQGVAGVVDDDRVEDL